MTGVAIREDMHVRIAAPAGSSLLAKSLRRARRAGLSRIAYLLDRARASERGVQAWIAAIEQQRQQRAIDVRAAVKVRLVDELGTLDVPTRCSGIDYLYVCIDGVPIGAHIAAVDIIRHKLASGGLSTADVIEHLINALCCVMVCHRSLVLLSPFTVLGQLGIAEAEISEHQLARVSGVAYQTRATLAITERVRGPSARVVRSFLAARVPIFVGTGAERPGDIGRYDYCRELAHRFPQLCA